MAAHTSTGRPVIAEPQLLSATATGIGQFFGPSFLYLGYVIVVLLAVAAILHAYIHVARRKLKRELARIDRIEEEQRAALLRDEGA
jgi:hypothetical protein